jgi:hypothetical protein
MSVKPDAVDHWRGVYSTKQPAEVSWFQTSPVLSLELIAALSLPPTAPIVDVGAGTSTLVDGLLAGGHRDITLVDITDAALAAIRKRIGDRVEVRYIAADVSRWVAPRQYALWHDRAVFHFLVEEQQRAGYRRAVEAALPVGAHAIIATFASDGPERCSGLPVRRYSSDALATELGSAFRIADAMRELHVTPSGGSQSFAYTVLQRVRSG